MRRNLALLVVGGVALGIESLLPFRAYAEQKKLMDKTIPTEMTLSSNKQKRTENFRIEAFIDDEKKELSISFLTNNYDKANLEEKTLSYQPAYQKPTQITLMNIGILRPELLTLDKMEQSAYVIPQNETEQLSPIENHPYMELMFDLADKGITWVENWLVKEFGLKSVKKILDKALKYLQGREELYQKNQEEEQTPNGYILEKISPYPVEGGRTATAWFYNFYFNVPKTKNGAPISFLAKVELGRTEPEYSDTPAWSGTIDDIVIEFSFDGKSTTQATTQTTASNGKDTPPETPKETIVPPIMKIEDFFPTEKEMTRISPKKIPILSLDSEVSKSLDISNPRIFSEQETKSLEPYIRGLVQMGRASYGILNDNKELDEIGFYMEAFTFGSAKDSESYIREITANSSDLTWFGLLAKNTCVFFEAFMRYGAGYADGKIGTQKQALDYINFLVKYNQRINGDFIFGEDKKGIRKMFRSSPEKIKEMISKPEDNGLYNSEEAIKYFFSPGIE